MKVQSFNNKAVITNNQKVMRHPSFAATGEINVVSGTLDILPEEKEAFDALFSTYGTPNDTVKAFISHKPSKTEGYNVLKAVIESSIKGIPESAEFAITYLKAGKLVDRPMNPVSMLYGLVHTMLDFKVK